MKLLTFAILLVLSFTLIFTSFHYSLLSNVSSSVNGSLLGTWWNGDWSYRKFHVIGNALNAGVDYAVQITVINGSGVDTGNTVYIDNKSRPDFGDLRFVSNDNITMLDYWIESVNYGQNATMWVKVIDDLSLSPSTIWMYYGNRLATDLSNGSNTFVMFDDFEEENINTSLWTIEGNIQTSNEYSFTGSRCMKQSGSYSRIILKTMPLTSNFSVCAYFGDVQPADNISSVLVVDNFSPIYLMLNGLDTDIQTSAFNYVYRIDGNNCDSVYYDTNITRTAAFHRMEIQYTDFAYSFIDGVMQPIQGAFNVADRIYIGNPWGNNASYGYWDTFYLRRCIKPEPIQRDWSSEEISGNQSGGVTTTTIPGEINHDHKVDLIDLVTLAVAYNSHCANHNLQGESASPKWNPNADLNNDGIVNLLDIVFLANHYGQHYP